MIEDQGSDTAGIARVRRDIDAVKKCQAQVGLINPRPPGAVNTVIQIVKKAIARTLNWYTRPIVEYQVQVTQALTDIGQSLELLQDRLPNLEQRPIVEGWLSKDPKWNSRVCAESSQGPIREDVFEDRNLSIVKEISPRDGMFSGNVDHYWAVGLSALRCIRLALATAGKETCKTILDLPCGHGRVLRTLKAAFPQAQLTACDLLNDGVDFCAKVLGATPVHSKEDPDAIDISGSFDLIWCGSLLTHLDRQRWDGFLLLFERLLSSGGVLVFTVHGRRTVQHLSEGTLDYGLPVKAVPRVLDEYYRCGFGYSHYGNSANYGISVSSPSWVLSQLQRFPDLRLLTYIEAGWDDHQDVVAFLRQGHPNVKTRADVLQRSGQ